MVVLAEEVLGKLKDASEASIMLHKLSTVALYMEDKRVVFHETTKVAFYELSEEMIHLYIASGEAFDKAGAYGIQGKGRRFVKSIEGDYYNVVGLPITRLCHEILELQKL